MGSVMGDTLKKFEEILDKEQPDAVMILGDTNSAIGAIVAERKNVPVYHMEAGNRSFDRNVPEELNRKLIDHIASFNLPYNDYSARNLISEGIHPRFICVTGSPVREVFDFFKGKVDASLALDKLNLKRGGYFLVSVHRQENVDQKERLQQVIDSISAVSKKWGIPAIVSTHPRTKKRIEEFGIATGKDIVLHDPFGYLDYNQLQLNAKCVISDSGTISEESFVMGFPAVSIRDSIERPESLDAGSIILSGLEAEHLISSIELAIASQGARQVPEGYDSENFSDIVLKFLFSTVYRHKQWTGIRTGK
jgi:UDP-N-acetylglucosamine 2-epimerase (non-hydrolysing)